MSAERILVLVILGAIALILVIIALNTLDDEAAESATTVMALAR
jgi:hypothetical protein